MVWHGICIYIVVLTIKIFYDMLKRMNVVLLETQRTEYELVRAARGSMTVAELIHELENCDPEAAVVFSNDNGYTYGEVYHSLIEERTIENITEREKTEVEKRVEKAIQTYFKDAEDYELSDILNHLVDIVKLADADNDSDYVIALGYVQDNY